jgi:hypothetical protein
MRENIDVAVELQILGLEMAVATLDHAGLSGESVNVRRIHALVSKGIDSIRYLLSNHVPTADQQMRIDTLMSHLEARLDKSADSELPQGTPAPHGAELTRESKTIRH